MMTHDQKIRAMFDMALEFLYDSQLKGALSAVQYRILDVKGRDDGQQAASWYFDGNTTDYTYVKVLGGIKIGDPEILDTFPTPRIGGEFADDATWDEILLEELDITVSELTFEDPRWLESYEAGFTSAVQTEIERVCRYQIHEDELAKIDADN